MNHIIKQKNYSTTSVTKEQGDYIHMAREQRWCEIFTKKNTFKKTMASFIFPLLLFVITIGIYIPSWFFISNVDEFSISYIHFFPSVLIPSLFMLVVGSLIFLLIHKFERISGVLADLLFGASIGAYIQSNFLNRELQQLNGTEEAWNNLSSEALLSVLIWVLCLLDV